MKRREFIAAGATATAAMLAASENASAAAPQTKDKFRLKYAPHPGQFRAHAGDDLLDQIRFMADQGFMAMEDNGMRGRSKEEQTKVGKLMESLGMTMGVFVANSNAFGSASFTTGDKAQRERFLADIKDSVEVAKRVNAKWVTVVPGELEARLEIGYQTANVIETLRMGAALCEPTGLVMVLEALNPWRDHPNMFLSKIPQAYMVCKGVNSPSCKILFDMYHQQITEGNIIPNIDKAWSEIAYFQIGDNPGRNEPTTGEINYRNIFKHIHSKGYKGVLGMEHGQSQGGKEGEKAVINAYRASDNF